ncbi:MAG: SsrA-binding protein SmpB [Patescibacteria group bacterium]
MALANNNRKVRFDYEILETLTAGIELLGLEVKSLRTHATNLEGAYVTIRGNEAYVIQMSIPPYQPSNTPVDYNPLRIRKLILTKKEIGKLGDTESALGLTIVPLKVYSKGRKMKVDIAVVRGKKKYDKRQTIKKRETDRDIRRTLKGE